MKIFSATQVRNWDDHTIRSEPVLSIDLMERAARACADWIYNQYRNLDTLIYIFCGKGNNGGDGLAIARLLSRNYKNIIVYILESSTNESKDFVTNLERLQGFPGAVHFIEESHNIPDINETDLVIDAIFGTGLNKAPAGLAEELIGKLNNSGATIISIDMPSGMYADSSSLQNTKIKATNTLTFQTLKLAHLMDENAAYFGAVHTLPIGLDANFDRVEQSHIQLVDEAFIKTIYKPRKLFTHKGDYGHACLLVGSRGMMGAAVLAARGCMHSGAGKLTTHIPECGLEIMQISVPEAIVSISGTISLSPELPTGEYDAIGIGPGVGLNDVHGTLLYNLFTSFEKPLVVDADALNTLSSIPRPLKKLPPGSIITPHGGEFERLFGKSRNDFERMELALEKASSLDCYIVLKGHHTFIATPSGAGFYNSTGNPGMATAGSGDVLTGVLTALLAQGYSALDAALLGVYVHGMAGDFAAGKLSMESLVAGDIIDHLGDAFLALGKVDDIESLKVKSIKE